MKTHAPPPPVVSPETWRQLVDTATAFRQLAPWEWMWDSWILGLMDPRTRKVRIATVLGNSRSVFGAVIYRGQEGVRWLLQILSGDIEPEQPEGEFHQDCLKLEFVPKGELDPHDLSILKTLGYKPSGRTSPGWPCFRSFRPGYYPWFLTQEEADLLLEDLRKVARFAELCHAEPRLFDGRGHSEFPFYSPALSPSEPLKKEDLDWHHLRLPPAPASVVFLPPATELKRWRQLPRLPGEIWELDSFYANAVVGEGDRPFFSKVALVVDADSGMVLGFHSGGPAETHESVAGQALGRVLERVGARPSTIVVQREPLRFGLRELAIKCGIKLLQTPALPMLEEARRSLRQAFAS